ncbi:extracellular solute-binding protein [bacterium]|nr:extracellular solute-binding protein [bacterium]
MTSFYNRIFIALLSIFCITKAENEIVIKSKYQPGTWRGMQASFSVDGKVQSAQFEAFKKKYPNISLGGTNTPIMIEGIGNESSDLLAIAAGNSPDVFDFNYRQSGTFVDKGFIRSLDEFIRDNVTSDEAKEAGDYDPNIMYKDELFERIWPKVMDAAYTLGPDDKKHYYFLPRSYDVRVMCYNKQLFQEAGLDPIRDVPKTWDELFEVGKKLTQINDSDSESSVYALNIGSDSYSSWTSRPFYLSMNSMALSFNNKEKRWTSTFNDPGAVEATDYYLSLLQKPWKDNNGKIRYGVGHKGDGWVKFHQGKLAIVFLTSSDLLMNSNLWVQSKTYDEVGIAKIPSSPIGKSVSELYGMNLGISSAIKDPAVIDACWKFIRFMGSDAAKKIAVDTYVENGFGRYILPEILKKYGYPEFIDKVPKDWAEAVTHSINNHELEPYGKNTQHIYKYMDIPISKGYMEEIGKNPNKSERIAKLQIFHDQAVKKANEKMIGRIPASEVGKRYPVAVVLSLIIFLLYGILFYYVWKAFSPTDQVISSHQGEYSYKVNRVAYILLAPAILTVLIFSYYPLFRGAMMAFQEYGVSTGGKYVGFENFAMVFFDQDFWLSILRSIYFSFLYITLVFFPPITLAILLSEIPIGKIFYRVIYYLPAVISGIIVMLMWKSFFDPAPDGVLNTVIGFLGFEPVDWFGNKNTAMIAIIIPSAWAGLGPGCLIYLAALKTVPSDLYEAAAIDGCGFFSRLTNITIPMIKPLIMINIIFAFIGAFLSSEQMLVMTGGGPDGATTLVGLEIFLNAFMFQRFGIATAMGWIIGFILMGFTVYQMKRLSNMAFKTAESLEV